MSDRLYGRQALREEQEEEELVKMELVEGEEKRRKVFFCYYAGPKGS